MARVSSWVVDETGAPTGLTLIPTRSSGATNCAHAGSGQRLHRCGEHGCDDSLVGAGVGHDTGRRDFGHYSRVAPRHRPLAPRLADGVGEIGPERVEILRDRWQWRTLLLCFLGGQRRGCGKTDAGCGCCLQKRPAIDGILLLFAHVFYPDCFGAVDYLMGGGRRRPRSRR